MTAQALALFALVALATVLTPGPTVLLALTNGSRHGVRVACAGIAGALLSDLLLIAAAGLGLGAVLAASQSAFSALKWMGAAYLAWLGIGLLRSSPAAQETPAREAPSAAGAALFRRSLLVALTNPKGLLFFSALLPQFIDPTAPQAGQYAMLGLVFVLADGAVMLGYALVGARWVSRLGSRGGVYANRGCGAVLVVLAGWMAMARRSTT
jgi:threonine/homoserine/homoserine lactone efflux protein